MLLKVRPAPRQILRCPQRRTGAQQLWTARREDLVGEEQLDLEPRIFATAVADREVEVSHGQIDDFVGGGDPDIDIGVPLLKPVQAQDKPLGGKGRRCGHSQCPGIVMRTQPLHRRLNAAKRFRQPRQQHLRRRGQLNRTVHAVEQHDAEVLLQRVDLMADRGRGDMQLVRSLAETQVPSCCLKCPKRRQRRKMTVHTDEDL